MDHHHHHHHHHHLYYHHHHHHHHHHDAVQWHHYHRHHHPITICQIVVGQSPNVFTTDPMFSQKFSPLSSLLEGGGGDQKSLEKWESGTGVRTKLKILACVPLVIVFFLH